MKFFLSVNIPKYSFQLDHHQQIFMAGSCFSEHISEKMQQNGFHVSSNPWGILFNPISLSLMIEKMIYPSHLSECILPVERSGVWYSLHHHSIIHATSEENLSNNIKQITIEASEKFDQSDLLIVTFGSAFVYESKERVGEVVANCHKLPGQLFTKRLLEVKDIVETWSKLIRKMPEKKIIFTVSPVRHSKDGLAENNISKSVLILVIRELMKIFPEQCFYFPSYEIVMDELRDYRFFKEDLVHPNETAVDYVWEKWCESFYDATTLEVSAAFRKVYLFAQHRPLDGKNATHLSKLSELQILLKKRYPFVNYSIFNIGSVNS